MKKCLHLFLWLSLPAAVVLLALYAMGLVGGGAKAVERKEYTSEGFVYTGTLFDGKFDGEGELTFSNGDTYKGGFSDGRMDGPGTYRAASGWRYEGVFLQGEMTELGVLYAENGDVLRREEDIFAFVSAQGWAYAGGLDERGQTGKGKFVFPDGSVYEGDFLRGLADGQGSYTAPNGESVYTGGFRAGLFEGRGIYMNPEGWRYEGGFSGGAFDGEGRITEKDGTTVSGTWEKGALIKSDG
jgi:hypothetical protein